jgi:eukaryotic-like serine/threonine-protein kinase
MQTVRILGYLALGKGDVADMAKEQPARGPDGEPLDETAPQWQPPAGATRAVVIAPAAVVGAESAGADAAEGDHAPDAAPAVPPAAAPAPAPAIAPAPGTSEPQAPSVSGTRLQQRAQQIGLEPTLQAGATGGSLAPPRPLVVGDIIGERYVIEEHISSGGFGAVYRASDRQIRHHQVALKLLHVPAADEQARQSALRELTLIASVSHPSVVQFKDYGWFEGRLWFAMPWYRGETLTQRYTDTDGPLPVSRKAARPLFERLARGLAAMHEVGIHHHDIKPDNIFVADIAGFDGGLPVLLDLGIAAARGEGPKGLTVEYAAPEIASAALGNHDKPIGGAADVFSLALVLRNLLEPETAPPSQGELLPMLHKRATEPVPPPSKRDLRHLEDSFERWLSLDPDERPTPEELADELAILTAPEERREARKRLLRRIVPIVLVAAAMVTVLVLQLREQKTELTVQREQLTQQVQQSEQLRQRTTEQLTQLELKSEQIGEQSEQLQRAIAIARRLDDQLDKAEGRNDTLTRKSRKLTEERDLLGTQRDALSRERDDLQSRSERLARERDGLQTERDSLIAERDRVARERDTVLAQRNDAIRQRDEVSGELASLQRELAQASAERDGLRKSFDSARDELKQLRVQVRELETERKQLEAARRTLDAQVEALQQSAAQPAAPAAAAPESSRRVRLRKN